MHDTGHTSLGIFFLNLEKEDINGINSMYIDRPW